MILDVLVQQRDDERADLRGLVPDGQDE